MKGRTELVYLPEQLFLLVEKVRAKLGMNRSAFYGHCIITYLESKSLVSAHLRHAASAERKRSGTKTHAGW
jgi:hypothetical protein